MTTNTLHALDFSHWKRQAVRQCFPEHAIRFISDAGKVPPDGVLLIWGMRPVPPGLAEGVGILRVEDGFLRSVGLGADLTRPLSWVVDGSGGIYFNAEQPSDLETLLAGTEFSPHMLARAANLRKRIVAQGVSKYNTGSAGWQRPAGVDDVILVPGQVETDASIRFGACSLPGNLDLLRAVRAANPAAYLLYKPHPDVQAGLRAAGNAEDRAGEFCDEVLTDVDMAKLLPEVDAVHVLTSLTGFEALLRGKRVHCHGLPFYAGWGLTVDAMPHPRRSRRLTLDELVAGALIAYPRYLGRDGKGLVTAETALDELQGWRQRNAGRTPWWREIFRMILRRVVGVR